MYQRRGCNSEHSLEGVSEDCRILGGVPVLEIDGALVVVLVQVDALVADVYVY